MKTFSRNQYIEKIKPFIGKQLFIFIKFAIELIFLKDGHIHLKYK